MEIGDLLSKEELSAIKGGNGIMMKRLTNGIGLRMDGRFCVHKKILDSHK